MDLEQQLEVNLEQITNRYASYVNCILTSLQAKQISVSNLRSSLLNLTAFRSGFKEQCKLLLGVKAELDEADTINKIIDVLSCTCSSFLNFKIFQFLVDEYDLKGDGDRLNYPEHLKAYIDKHNISQLTQHWNGVLTDQQS